MTHNTTRGFSSLLTNGSFGGETFIVNQMYQCGNFYRGEVCSSCSSPATLESVSYKKPGTRDRETNTQFRWRCKSTRCRKTITLFKDTIWTDVRDKQLFMFVIDGFLHHWTNESLIQETGADERTVVKYILVLTIQVCLKMDLQVLKSNETSPRATLNAESVPITQFE